MGPLARVDPRTICASVSQSLRGSCRMSSSSASTAKRLPNRDAALKALYDDVAANHMFPFWATSTDVEHDEVKQLLATPRAVPYLWRCERHIEPILHRAVELVTMDDSERRSL